MYAGTVCALRVVAQHGFRYWLSYGPPDARWPADTPPTHPPTFTEFVAPPQPEMLVDGPPEFPATAPFVQSTVEEVVCGFRSHEALPEVGGGGNVFMFSVCVVTPLGVVISAEVTS
jgi:hypothetical protein